MKPHPHEIQVEHPRYWTLSKILAVIGAMSGAVLAIPLLWDFNTHNVKVWDAPAAIERLQDHVDAGFQKADTNFVAAQIRDDWQIKETRKVSAKVDATSEQVSNLIIQVKTLRKAVDSWTNHPPIDWSAQLYSMNTRTNLTRQ